MNVRGRRSKPKYHMLIFDAHDGGADEIECGSYKKKDTEHRGSTQ